jgi:hypothetical protein
VGTSPTNGALVSDCGSIFNERRHPDLRLDTNLRRLGASVTRHRIGAPKGQAFVTLSSEVILAGSVLLATGLTVLTAHYGDAAIRAFLST